MKDIVYRLGPGCEVDDIVEGNMYIGKVQGLSLIHI